MAFEQRILNVLQLDICHRNTPIGQICMFSNLSRVPVRGINCRVGRTDWDATHKECQRFKNCCLECDCAVRFELNTVCYGKGVALDLKNEEYYAMVFSTLRPPVVHQREVLIHSGKGMVIKMDGYALSYFLTWLKQSCKYVELATNYLTEICSDTRMFVVQLGLMTIMTNRCKISLQEPDGHLLDLTWARMACKTVHELQQLHSTMSWLSTLGGACSALGEGQERFAMVAGRISMEQLRLALRMGDKVVVAQCKLYFSLSLIQRGRTSRARVIVYEQFMNQKNSRVPDAKTMNMCRGIWARLKYEIRQRRALKGKPTGQGRAVTE